MSQKSLQFKRNIVCFAALLLAVAISACTVGPRQQPHLDAKKELDALKGPEVKGMSGTLKDQAEAAVKVGNLGQAEILYKQLLDKEPANNEWHFGYADVLRREDRCPEAVVEYDAIIAKDKDNAASIEGKGLCVMAKGDSPGATKLFSQVMQIDPKRWRTLNAIGILFATRGMSSESIAYYNEALKYNPGATSVLNNMGLTYALGKHYDDAVAAFEKARGPLPETSPDAKRVALNEALTYGLAGKLNEAEKLATPYLSRAALYNNLGFYAYLAKDDALAKSYLNMALTNSPTYYERAWNNLQSVSGGEMDKAKDKGK